ncbi:MAG: hypothetical protein JWP80_3460 [Pseudomonas sp.]|nr:hypothetical protein [Pseudomonas sp.]
MIKTPLSAMNPVSIIALFAALSEASAATALPFLDENNRDLYVWFLIVFPSALTFLFFLTLNFNYKVLYAPSDFSNEKNFLKIIKKNDKEDNKVDVPIKPIKHQPHQSVLTRSGLSSRPPDKESRTLQLVLLVGHGTDTSNHYGFAELLEHIPRHTRHRYTFAVVTPDSKDLVFL